MIRSVIKAAAVTALRQRQQTGRHVRSLLPFTTDNNAARPAVIDARRDHGVFAVMATWCRRQLLFVITESDAVALVWIRAAAPDQLQGLLGFGRQFLQTDGLRCQVTSRQRRRRDKQYRQQ